MSFFNSATVKTWTSGLSQLWHGVDPAEQEQAATAAALERRRAWTKDYAARTLQIWDLVRKLRVARQSHDLKVEPWESLWPEEEWLNGDLSVLGISRHVESRDARRFERRLRSLRRDVDARYPGLLSSKSTFAFLDESPDLAAPEEAPQMVKDLARETVVVCGEPRSPLPDGANSHYEAVHMAIVQGLLDAGTATEAAVALASAAILATWRTKVGADAWDRVENLNKKLHRRRRRPDNTTDYALVSRPTEPLTVVDVGKDKVVVTAHSHLSEVRIVEPDDDAAGRCGDERAFFAVTSRVTVAVGPPGFKTNRVPDVHLVARRCVLTVVLVADDPRVSDDDHPAAIAAAARDNADDLS